MSDDRFTRNAPIARSYASELLTIDHGEGVYLFDRSGNRYLDFGSGIAVNSFGYGDMGIAQAAFEQMKRCVHVSNLYTTEQTVSLARRLVSTGSFDGVHFGNSGTEAIEAAIKYARLYANRTSGPEKHRLICFTHAFHGRTMGALSCTPNPKYSDPYQPLIPGIDVLPYNDPEALRRGATERHAGIIVEVIQGEGGLASMTRDFAEALNEVSRTLDIILIADEVQTGLGRTGYFYASEYVGMKPDIVTIAKPLAAGLPLSATLIPSKVNELLHAGDHGSTFGGGPVTCAVAGLIVDRILQAGFLGEVREKGKILRGALERIASTVPGCSGVKGLGMLAGIEIDTARTGTEAIGRIVTAAQEAGLLILRSGEGVLRLAPPLIISPEEIVEGCTILEKVLRERLAG